MPVAAAAAPEPSPAPRPVAQPPAAGAPPKVAARESTKDLMKDPPRPVVRVAEEVKTVRRSLDSLLSEIEAGTVSKTTKDVPVTAPGEPVPPPQGRATFAAARKATIMGMATPPPPAADRTSQMPSFDTFTPPPGGATTSFGNVPSRASEGEDRPEPTVMKQAAELLEEALREAGGSPDEIGNNPLFGGVTPIGRQASDHGREPMPTPVGDPLALTTRDDAHGIDAQERTLAMSRDAMKRDFASTMPLDKKPDPALASTMLSQTQSQPPPGFAPVAAPSAPPPALGASAVAPSAPPAATEKKKGSALPLILGLVVLVLLGGGAAGAWKMGYLKGVLGGGGSPIPTVASNAPTAPATTMAQVAPTAPSVQPSATATTDTSVDAGAPAVDAASASDAASVAVPASASASATAAVTAAATPKFVYRPPPPKPTATDDTNPSPPASATATAAAPATAAPTATAAPAPTSTGAAPATTATSAPKQVEPGDDLKLK
jgi:hypothetical protein